MLPFLFLLQAAAADPPPKRPAPPPAATDTLHRIVVDAIRNCAQPTTGEVVVCAPDRGIAEGYRIPKMDERFARNLRPSGRGEVEAVDLGIGGLGTCSKVGQAGAIGCTKNNIDIWAAEQRLKRDQQPKDR